MADMNREQLNSAIAEVGRQVLTNPDIASGTLSIEQVVALKAAGLSDDVIGNILREEGLDEDEVAGYTTSRPTTDPGIIVFTQCVLGTCKNVTIVVSCTPVTLPPTH